MADLINATLGAGFGAIASPIVDQLIEGLKFCLRCPGECRALGESLKRIQLPVKNILAHNRDDPDMGNWLIAIGKCVEDAKEVLQKCKGKRPYKFLRWRTVKYGREILQLRDRIKELVGEAALVLLAPKSSSCGITQDVPEKIFGMEEYFMRVKSLVCKGHSREGNSCIGIRGMGGAGKTLLTQMVNNDQEIQEVFGKDSVIWVTVGRDANVSEIYKRMRKHLKGCCDGGSLEDQRKDLMNAFASARALLILDDVWDCCVRESKEMVYWLNIAKGSKCVTLITTRDEWVTHQCVNGGEEIILRLSEELSWQLFCTHAFGIDMPMLNAEEEDMARAVCKKCDCLPLALKVIGCAMKGKSDWKRMLRHMQAPTMRNQSIEQELYSHLKVSYDELDGPAKICFLYFAAFPEDYEVEVKELFEIWVVDKIFGEELSKEDAMEDAHFVLAELVRRSLIEVSKVDGGGALIRVKVHDILRDLANQLVSKGKECDRECLFKVEEKGFVEFPGSWLGCEMKVRRLSLWGSMMERFPEELLAPHLKICMLHGNPWAETDLDDWSIGEKFFEKLHALKLLQVFGYTNVWQLPKSLGGLRSLEYLDLSWCRMLKLLPESMGGLGSLQHLNLSDCRALEQLPESIGGLGSLQHLTLSECRALEQLPESMGGLGSLQHLTLSECRALKQLPESLGGLGSLQHLNLEGCLALEQLPKSMGGLGSLQHLNLSGCWKLEQLPESMGGLGSLQHLNLSECRALEQLPKSMGVLGCLQHLNLFGCWELKQLPESMGGLVTLQHLNLSDCRALEQLPKSMGGLGSLQHLNLEGCWEFKQLPESMGGLGSLQHLNISRCSKLKQLPESMGGLESLHYLDVSGCSELKQLPESMVGFGSLLHLNLRGCWALEQLPMSIGGLGSLHHLNLSLCWKLKQLPESMGGLGSLQHLNLSSCWKLEQLLESMGGLVSLQHLNLSGCQALEQLPESMGGLGSLQHLNLSKCWALEQLPESMGGLESLHYLDVSGCSELKQLPMSIGGLGSLQHLNLEGCWQLKQLPESMGGLGSLQHLNLSLCWQLKQLPESMGGLVSLQHLNLSGCVVLKQLPESMGGLVSLQHLNLSGWEALKQLPESMGGLGSLQHLNLLECRALEQLPESMGGLGSLQHLTLEGCQALKQLPKSMGGLGSLQHLNLSCCKALEYLPKSMGELVSLQFLDITDCKSSISLLDFPNFEHLQVVGL